MKVPGNIKPSPIEVGRRNGRYAQSGRLRPIDDNPTVPMSKRIVPETSGHFRRLVYVMRKPVAVPTVDEAKDGSIRRSPELVADSRSTAWKKRGMLKVTALLIMAPMKLLMISPARGLCPIDDNVGVSFSYCISEVLRQGL